MMSENAAKKKLQTSGTRKLKTPKILKSRGWRHQFGKMHQVEIERVFFLTSRTPVNSQEDSFCLVYRYRI
jgi:hypothetical protein